MSETSEDAEIDLFSEPLDYYEPEKPHTFASHDMLSGHRITVRLVGHDPLWGHLLWNAARTISEYLEERAPSLIQGRTILEFGAGAGLPSLVCATLGAEKVVVTDYPDTNLIENLLYNISHCVSSRDQATIVASGFLWGSSVEPLLTNITGNERAEGFDILILADVVFNHSEHSKLVTTVKQTMKRSSASRALVFFTPYRPWLLDKDLAFFELARGEGFVVNKVLEKLLDKALFEEDPGDEILRRTVFGYELTWEDTTF